MFLVQNMGYHYCVYVAITSSINILYLEGFHCYSIMVQIQPYATTDYKIIFMSSKRVAYGNICMNCLYQKYAGRGN